MRARGEGGTPWPVTRLTILFHALFRPLTERLGAAPLLETMFSRFRKARDRRITLREKALCRTGGDVGGNLHWPNQQTFAWKGLSKHVARPKVKAQLAREMAGVTEPERANF